MVKMNELICSEFTILELRLRIKSPSPRTTTAWETLARPCPFTSTSSSQMRLKIFSRHPANIIRVATSSRPHRCIMTSSTSITVSDLIYLPPTHLASLLKDSSIEAANASTNSANMSVAVIDVRDSDHIGGHIRSSTWVPSDQLPTKLPELVRTLADKDMVVFHCALSQVRGPSAALKYVRERQRLLGKESGNQEQRVCVLEGGFTMWQARYGEDVSLTEGYVKDIWQD
jgi:rhodanese-related sulfurtransferase